MTFAPIRRRALSFLVSCLAVGAAPACGGVYTQGSTGDGTSGGGASGTSTASAGGTASRGGATPGGGLVANGGSRASGGGTSIGTGGAVACGPCAMPPCAPGEGMHVPPSGCCSVCGPDCSTVDCSLPFCGPGYVVQTPPGKCCPVCVLVPVPVTAPGTPGCDLQGYTSLVNELAQKYQEPGCKTAADCAIVNLTACGVTNCGIAVWAGMASSFVDNVASFDANRCTSCGPSAEGCQDAIYTAECVGGVCTRVP